MVNRYITLTSDLGAGLHDAIGSILGNYLDDAMQDWEIPLRGEGART